MSDLEQDVRKIMGALSNTYWGRRIVWVEHLGSFSGQDEWLAGRWVTCACGKMCNRKPFKRDLTMGDTRFEPIDHNLKALGALFCEAVENNWINDAAMILIKIETRGEEVHKRYKGRRGRRDYD